MKSDGSIITLKLALKFLLMLAILLLIANVHQYLPSITHFDQRWIDEHTRDNGVEGIIVFVGVSMALLSVGLPRQIVAFLAGYSYGFALGCALAMLAAVMSCASVAMLSRVYGRKLIHRLFSQRIVALNRFVSRQPVQKTIIIRLLPFGNNLITNMLAGVSRMSLVAFIGGSAIGYIPQMVIFSLMGKGVLINSQWKLTLSVILFGICAIMGAYLYRKNKQAAQLSHPEQVISSDNTHHA